MSSLYDALRHSTAFKKIEVDDLLFVQYTCDPGGPRTKIWSQTNYFTYVMSGRMTLKTPDRDFEIKAGESYFVKKGAFTIPQFFEEVFCDLIIFFRFATEEGLIQGGKLAKHTLDNFLTLLGK